MHSKNFNTGSLDSIVTNSHQIMRNEFKNAAQKVGGRVMRTNESHWSVLNNNSIIMAYLMHACTCT